MVVYYKSTYTEWDTEQFFLCVSTLETSFGAEYVYLKTEECPDATLPKQ
jgi:hypothetical protein